MRFLSPAHPRTLLVFLALLAVPVSSQLAAAQSPPRIRKAPPPPPPPPATDQQQFVAYWTAETGWNSELQLRNNAVNEDVTVTPVLRLPDGTETTLAPVTVKPQEVKAIDLDTAIAAAAAPQLVGTYGSVVLRYRSPTIPSLYAAMMIRKTGHSVAFHIDATSEDQTQDIGSREGIWWLPNGTANDYLILTNQGQSPLQLDLSLFDASGKASTQVLALASHAMSRFSLRQLVQASGLAGSYGGLKISTNTRAGSLDSLHFLYDETAGFSAILKMFNYDPRAKLEERDYAKTSVWTLRAPMLAISNPGPALAFPLRTILQPQLFLRNTTPKPINAALRFNWRTAAGATGKAQGPSLQLNPYETRRIDVAALQDGKTLPIDANWTSVTITTNSKPDELMAVAASYDATLRYGAQTPFSDQLTFQWEGGMWEYDPYHNSIITAGNGGTKPTQAAFTIFYNQGTKRYDLEQTLQPAEQMWVDVGKLIREHVPDKNGKTLPADLTSGSYEFCDLTNIGVGALFEGKVIYDKTYGHVVYGCGICCGYYQPKLFFDPLLLAAGSTSGDGVTALNQCTRNYDDVSGDFDFNWSSANTGIVTVDNYGTHTGVFPGSTTSGTSGTLTHYGHTLCPDWNPTPSGGANVKPTISGPNTLWWFNGLGLGVSGYASQITLTTNSGGNGTSYQWAITAGSDKVSLSTSTSATVQVTSTGQSSTANDVSITVTVGGVTSNPYNLTVRAPYTLGTDPDNRTPVYAQDSTYVWNISIYYRIFDNLLSPMPNPVSVKENFTMTAAPDYTNENWSPPSAGCIPLTSTAFPADFADLIEGDYPSKCPTPVYNTQQNGPAVFHIGPAGQEWRVGTCTNGSGPRVQTETFQKYTDHAAHTGITSPAP